MPKPAHTRCTFEGVIGSVAAPLERWSFNVNFPADGSFGDGPQALDDLIAAGARDAYAERVQYVMGADVVLTQVKVASVLETGKVAKRADGSYAQGVWVGSLGGSLDAQAMPLNVALCVSLKTLRAGATGKGRFFLPWPGLGVSSADKRLTAANAQFVGEKTRDFLNTLAGVMVNQPQVVSSKGYMSEVIGIKIGRVPDTMRSRRDDLPEGYVTVPLA